MLYAKELCSDSNTTDYDEYQRAYMDDLISKIRDRSAVIGIIGLGYVGLPLVMTFSEKFTVIGLDVHKPTVESLMKGISHIQDIPSSILSKKVGKSFFPTDDPSELARCDFMIICVPTPLAGDRIPDLSYVSEACQTIQKVLRKGQFIILESTTFPGTTEDIVIPILEKSGLKAREDFGVAYSPERIDPGNRQFSVSTVPKVVGGIDDRCSDVAVALYGSVIDTIVKVRDTMTAESVKMVENIFRNVNIALANELALIFERMGIDTWEVITAAATKPYGYMAFYPGPGIGGHCIPLDPYYMSYKAKKYGFIPRFIETSGEINEFMKVHAINLAERGLRKVGRRMRDSRIAVMGLAYKKNIGDPRESPSIDIIDELKRLGAEIVVFDPYVPTIVTDSGAYRSEDSMESALKDTDCAMFVVDHDAFKDDRIPSLFRMMRNPVIIDCKSIIKKSSEITYLGIGKINDA